jgi:hypothetical protein
LEEHSQRLLNGFLACEWRRRALRQNALDIRLEIHAGLLGTWQSHSHDFVLGGQVAQGAQRDVEHGAHSFRVHPLVAIHFP